MYALHPGPVRSVSDGDIHHIGVQQLVSLYRLLPHEYVVWRDAGMIYEEFIHLGPQRHIADYKRIRNEIAAARSANGTRRN